MKFPQPYIMLWDEMDSLRRNDFPFQLHSELTAQVPVKTQGNNHFCATLLQSVMSTYVSEEAALFIFLLCFSFD
jgi:hypothetical protein